MKYPWSHDFSLIKRIYANSWKKFNSIISRILINKSTLDVELRPRKEILINNTNALFGTGFLMSSDINPHNLMIYSVRQEFYRRNTYILIHKNSIILIIPLHNYSSYALKTGLLIWNFATLFNGLIIVVGEKLQIHYYPRWQVLPMLFE